MSDRQGFSAIITRLEHDIAELDSQLTQKSTQARDLQLAAFASATRRRETEKAIDKLIRETCELEMELADLTCLQHQQHPESKPCQKLSCCMSRKCV